MFSIFISFFLVFASSFLQGPVHHFGQLSEYIRPNEVFIDLDIVLQRMSQDMKTRQRAKRERKRESEQEGKAMGENDICTNETDRDSTSFVKGDG